MKISLGLFLILLSGASIAATTTSEPIAPISHTRVTTNIAAHCNNPSAALQRECKRGIIKQQR